MSIDTNTGMKGLPFNKVGLAIIVIIALSVAIFQFAFAEPEGRPANADNAVTTGAAAHDAKAADESANANVKAAKTKKADLDSDPAEEDFLFGGSTDASEDAAPSAYARSGPKKGSTANTRIQNMRILYFGEDDWDFIGVLTLRFILNVIFAYILICLIFAKDHRIQEYSFSYFVSNILIFMVTSLLASVRVRQGFAFGLFAILSILRFRTEQLQVREMTFLFAALILGVINSLETSGLTIFAILWANIILCICVYICDKTFIGTTDVINLVYDNTSHLAKDKKKELFDDIKNRFGYDVTKVAIVKMNYLTDSAEVKLVYKRN